MIRMGLGEKTASRLKSGARVPRLDPTLLRGKREARAGWSRHRDVRDIAKSTPLDLSHHGSVPELDCHICPFGTVFSPGQRVQLLPHDQKIYCKRSKTGAGEGLGTRLILVVTFMRFSNLDAVFTEIRIFPCHQHSL